MKTKKFEAVNESEETLTIEIDNSTNYKDFLCKLSDKEGKTLEAISLNVDTESGYVVIENIKFSGFALKLLLDFINQK